MMKTIIFVCHGNICRSIAAECIAKYIIKQRNIEDKFHILSRACSTEEIGSPIYAPMKRELTSRGIEVVGHYAEMLSVKDYRQADVIFYMDKSNKKYISKIINDESNKIKPITIYESEEFEVEDPWYSQNYSKVCNELIVYINHIIDKLPESN